MTSSVYGIAHRAGLTWRTVRHLRPIQVWNRVVRRWPAAIHPDVAAATLRPRPAPWIAPVAGEPTLFGPDLVRIHERERRIAVAADWSPADMPLLWRYHLHYFEDLTAAGAVERVEWHRSLVQRWIDENPAGRSPAWDAYPTSIRVVSWLKWWLRGESLQPRTVRSLALQIGHLERRIEWHLLGNHLFENGKALWFAGACFAGATGARWLEAGREIVAAQLREQVLPDGGHFERSPMYHARMLENVLDLVNLERGFGREPAPALVDAAGRMLDWLSAMTHPDGSYALFNDAAHGQAPSLAELRAYARRLSLVAADGSPGTTLLRDSGYVRVVQGPWLGLLDIAPLGPDYLPGHGHADTLTFELSLRGEPLVVDAGTSTYEDGAQRRYERSTSAHNTLAVADRDSSEVWLSFRVGRRARVLSAGLDALPDGWRAHGRHDGYAAAAPRVVHARVWRFTDAAVEIDDELDGRGIAPVAWRVRMHPSVQVRPAGGGAFVFARAGTDVATFAGDPALRWHAVPGTYAPRFGRMLPATVLEGRGELTLPARLRTRLAAIGN